MSLLACNNEQVICLFDIFTDMYEQVKKQKENAALRAQQEKADMEAKTSKEQTAGKLPTDPFHPQVSEVDSSILDFGHTH